MVAVALLASAAGTGLTAIAPAPAAADPVASPRTSISTSPDHSCAVTTEGGVKCWGDNTYGQLGDGTTTSSTAPVDVVGLETGAIAVAAGLRSSCAVTTTGGLKCWGTNHDGMLGNGSPNATLALTPVDVTGLSSGVEAVSLTGTLYRAQFGIEIFRGHACALTSSGAVMCWGANESGQLGNGSSTGSNVPVQVVGLESGATAVTTGNSLSCAIAAGGRAKCWGSDAAGQLGNGAGSSSTVPVDVVGLTSGVRAIATSETGGVNTSGRHVCAVTAAGGVRCWGSNSGGQLGDGTTVASPSPVPVGGLETGVADVAVGSLHSCAVSASGAVTCWGGNGSGRLGNGTITSSLSPVAVSTLGSGVVGISASEDHTCVITTAKAVRCWGDNQSGQLGNGQRRSNLNPTPTAVDGIGSAPVASADGGQGRSCALVDAGVRCWGSAAKGALGDGSTTGVSLTPQDVVGLESGVSALAVGDEHACALTTVGGVWCWGAGASGRLGNGAIADAPTPVPVTGLSSGVVAVAAGWDHSCAVLADGGMRCWGEGAWGALGRTSNRDDSSVPVTPNSMASGVAAISTGNQSTCALMTTSGIKCWGRNDQGQAGAPVTTNAITTARDVPGLTSGVAAVSTGEDHACAVTTAGSVTCWGNNDDQQLGAPTPTRSSTPIDVVGEAGISSVEVGAGATCVVATSGQSRCWGTNELGTLGRGTSGNGAQPPGDVIGLGASVASIGLGRTQVCAVTTSGTAACWGANTTGQLGSVSPNWVPGTVVGGHEYGPDSVAGPTIEGSRSPAANADGWNNEPVTVSFECLSPALASCTPPVTVTADGAGQSVTGTAADLYGQSASDTVSGISIDRVAPGASGIAATAPNAAGWYRTPVTMDWTCEDDRSGIADGACPVSSVTVGEGTAVSVSGSVTDRAGNLTTASSESVKVDLTTPSTGASSPPTWAGTDVTLTLSATDALSGVATTEYQVDDGPVQTGTEPVVSGQGTHTVSYWSTDVAGNLEPTQTVQVRIDVQAPSITANRSVPPNAAGWNHGPVTVSFDCGDEPGGSEVVSCTPAQTFSTEVDTTVTGTATDSAGNSASVQVPVRIDLTAPVVTADVPPPNANGWFDAAVQVPFTCADSGGSGIASCPDPVVLSGEGADQPVVATAFDAAGNAGHASGATVSIDTTAPTITGASLEPANGDGSYDGTVTVRWTCADALSGVVACPADEQVSGEGVHVVSRSVTDRAGNTSTGQVTIQINEDSSNDPGTVHGTITDATNGQPVAGALVLLRLASTNAVVATTSAGTDGTYTFPAVADGSYRIYAVLNKAYQGAYSAPVAVALGTDATVDRSLQPALVITGVVRTPSGTPISGATVRVAPSSLVAVTDATGTYRLTGNLPGAVTLRFSAHGMVPSAPTSFALTADRSLDQTLVPAAAGGGIKGTITARSSGAPLAGATVRIWAKDSTAYSMTISTGADGRYSIASLPVGTYEIDVIRPSYQVRWFGDSLSRSGAAPVVISTGCTSTPDTSWGDPCAAPASIAMRS